MRRAELLFKQAFIDKLTHENAVLKRLKFAAQSEAFTPEQKSLLDETFDMDLAAVACEIESAQPKKPGGEKRQPKRAPLPAHLPRTDVHQEPSNTPYKCGCAMKRIGEDVSEKLGYTPGVFTVERHVRGKWVCAECETLVQAPMAPHIIDKGTPTTRLLAQVLVAKYLDHLPLYRQAAIFERAGMVIARSTLALWLDEHRQKVLDGSATAKAIDYSRRRWEALTRYLNDGRLPIDNNWVENQIRPIALGRSNWLFAGSLRAGKRASGLWPS